MLFSGDGHWLDLLAQVKHLTHSRSLVTQIGYTAMVQDFDTSWHEETNFKWVWILAGAIMEILLSTLYSDPIGINKNIRMHHSSKYDI